MFNRLLIRSLRTPRYSPSCRLISINSTAPTFRIPPNTAVHRFGDHKGTHPLFRDLGWTIQSNERWAVVGGGSGRKSLVEVLLNHHRLSPYVGPPGRHPFLYSETEPSSPSSIYHLKFSTPPSPSGDFSDYTARYHTLHESDRLTLLEKMLWALDPDPLTGGKKGGERAREVAKLVGVEHLLDTPFVGLSNGQTRRARMALGLLSDPKFLVVEEPFAGLDPAGRKDISDVLYKLQETIRIILVVRGGESLPSWVTNVIESPSDGQVRFGVRGDEKEWWAERMSRIKSEIGLIDGKAGPDEQERREQSSMETPSAQGKTVVELKDVDIHYGPKRVLDSVDWTIRTGTRWHLSGSNGSGKTTLLSLILGDHPRSFSLPAQSIKLFGRPRRQIATPILGSLIGHCSPEIFKSFPRSTGLSLEEAIGTGYLGIYSRRALSDEQTTRIRTVLRSFFPSPADSSLGDRKFAEQSPNDQSVILFIRSIIHSPELLILDEPFAFMEQDSIERCRLYLDRLGDRSAVVWVGHWAGERPWTEDRGSILRLESGKVIERVAR
ncbi:Predicted transporter (ABC superfamily) [Phaffia rhodozyma]|uniref:Predicted transporter (ABC superfamily) n=1 Tax=Phaffia rhodozyma TaxID=264483 RepID=A0A0F7SUK2_PHARH|nr:Predicted transporter (ABC superfamily) [Phaffia rhodozyma]